MNLTDLLYQKNLIAFLKSVLDSTNLGGLRGFVNDLILSIEAGGPVDMKSPTSPSGRSQVGYIAYFSLKYNFYITTIRVEGNIRYKINQSSPNKFIGVVYSNPNKNPNQPTPPSANLPLTISLAPPPVPAEPYYYLTTDNEEYLYSTYYIGDIVPVANFLYTSDNENVDPPTPPVN